MENYQQKIIMMLDLADLNKTILVTIVYAKCFFLDKLQIWDNIYGPAYNINLLWLVGGDFNVIMHDEEKLEGFPAYPSEYEDFAFFFFRTPVSYKR